MNRLSDLLKLFFFICLLSAGAQAFADDIHNMVEDAYSKVPSTLETVPDSIRTVAILNVNVPEGSGIDPVSVRERFETILVRSRRFTVVERQMLENLLAEQELSLTGLINEAKVVSTGKLIGVQGFFNLTFSRTGETLTLTVRLIDVQTGGVVYSEAFTGESYARTRMGFGVGFVYHPGVKSDIGVYEKSGREGYEYGYDDPSVLSAPGIQAMFTVKAGTQAVKSMLFGTDISLSLYPDRKEFKPPVVEGATEGRFESYGIEHDTGLALTLAVEPKLYLSLKQVMDLPGDWINPFIGAGIYMHVIALGNGGWFSDAEGNYDPKMKKKALDPLFQISPLIGVEFNLSSSISVYAQSIFHLMTPGVKMDEYISKNDRGWWANSKHTIEKGIGFSGGVKYYVW